MNGAKRAFPFLILNKCKCLRDSRKGQKVFRGTCGIPAKAKKFSERLAGLPQTPKHFPRHLRDFRKHQKVFRGTCGTPANTKKYLERLAGLPQTPKSFPGDLRDSRKHFEEVSGLCSVSAKVLFPILAFAGLLQGRFSLFWRLPYPPPPCFADQRRPKGVSVQKRRRNPPIFAHIL